MLAVECKLRWNVYVNGRAEVKFMRIHHLNCGCMCPLGGALFDGFSRGLTAHLVCHCLLIETNQELVLVDTGFGLRDVHAPYSRLSPFLSISTTSSLSGNIPQLSRSNSLAFRHKIYAILS